MLDTSSERYMRASSGETVSNSRIFKKTKPKNSGGYDFASDDETDELGIPDSVLKKVNFAKTSSPTSGGGSVVKTNMVLSFMFDKVE